ncbi:MAG: hypothetical protein J6N72_03440 [Psychrobacter sp.]|nr:hypothetical protein [Psychrobacter sp.]
MFKKQQLQTKNSIKAIFDSGGEVARQRLDESRRALMAQFPVHTTTQIQDTNNSKG